MNANRRMELLNEFAIAGAKGLTMTEGKFNAQDVNKLDGLIERQSGPTGIYSITGDGLNYLKVKTLAPEMEPVAA